MQTNDSIDPSSSEWELRSSLSGRWRNQDKIPEVKGYNNFITVDWMEDEIREHERRKAKTSLNKRTSLIYKIISLSQYWLVLASIGIIIGFIAACLNIITAWLASLRVGYCSEHFYLNKSFCCLGIEEGPCENWRPWTLYSFSNYLFYVLICVFFAFLAAFLVKVHAPSAAGSGISEIKCIVSGFVTRGFLGKWTLLLKSIALPLAIASGLSVGKEGPSVHYSVCVGNMVAKLFKKYRESASKSRDFLVAASAAGVAVAFGSPMGGVLFSVEEISPVFQLSTISSSYFCSLVAVSTLASLNPFRTGQLVMFEVTYDSNWHYFEIPLYIVLGIFGGLYGIIVTKLNLKFVALRKRFLISHPIKEVVILAALTASICYFNDFLKTDMTESMQILFHECNGGFKNKICDPNMNKTSLVTSLTFATIARMFFIIITYGCKVPAGIFVPSMATGATFGRALGVLFDNFYRNHQDLLLFKICSSGEHNCIIPGTYAFLGAAAALCGITNMTVTVVIIMYELTGALRYIVPTMIVVAITQGLNEKYKNGPIADQMIEFNGLPFIDTKKEYHFNTSVTSAMSHVVVAFSSDESECLRLNELSKILEKTSCRGYPVIKSSSRPLIIGYISKADIESVISQNSSNGQKFCSFVSSNIGEDKLDLSFLVNKHPFTISFKASLDYVTTMFVKLGPRYILIEKEGIFVGIITRKDILRYEFTKKSLQNNHLIYKNTSNKMTWIYMRNIGSKVAALFQQLYRT